MTSGEATRLEQVVIRFAGDSGDGMQLTGDRFTHEAAAFGNDLATQPNFPAEIRAPQGTLPGVSSFQIQIADYDILTAGDRPDVLVAMNPAALKANVGDLPRGALIIANSDEFTKRNLAKVGYAADPLSDGTLADFRVHRGGDDVADPRCGGAVGGGEEGRAAGEEHVRARAALVDVQPPRRPDRGVPAGAVLGQAGRRGGERAGVQGGLSLRGDDGGVRLDLRGGPGVADAGDLPSGHRQHRAGVRDRGRGRLAGLPVLLGTYPITPASDILHELSKHKRFGVTTFQAEDEIAGVGAALGASLGGALGVTSTSGPGLALKSETIGLGVMTELPLVVIDVQRGGPSTGLPTKTEQSDLLQAMFGRNGECPVAVIAPRSPADCFDAAVEAARIALIYRTPVLLLSDGAIANGSEPWAIPRVEQLERIDPDFVPAGDADEHGFAPYARDRQTLARPLAVPGTPGREHRIGGLEKADGSGNISYDPANHDLMVRLRQAKIDRIAVPDLVVDDPSGDARVAAGRVGVVLRADRGGGAPGPARRDEGGACASAASESVAGQSR